MKKELGKQDPFGGDIPSFLNMSMLMPYDRPAARLQQESMRPPSPEKLKRLHRQAKRLRHARERSFERRGE